MIKEKVDISETFAFSKIETDVMELEINHLNPKKANTRKGITTKVLKDNCDICCQPMHDLSPSFMKDIFINSNYNGPVIRTEKQFYQPRVKTTFKGQESLTYFAPKVWNMVPKEYKSLRSLDKFKKEIKTWKPCGCPCRL